MKAKYWLFLFLIDAFIELVSHIFGWNQVNFFTKPLLMPMLIGYCISRSEQDESMIRKLVILALVASWIGDTVLMFQSHGSIYFMLGLVAFLIAHILYIVSFTYLSSTASLSEKAIIVLLFLVYTTSLVTFLWPGLGEMKIPVIVYAMVLTVMGALGVIKNTINYPYITLGVVSFVVSDSILAFNKFLVDVPFSGVLIMGTYILAQLLIVTGLSKRFKTT